MSFEDWCIRQREWHPQFDYWYTVWKVELLLLFFCEITPGRQLPLIVCTCSLVVFALDHTHYSRWLPVHIRDMVTLRARVPDVAEQFSRGKFVVRKTNRRISDVLWCKSCSAETGGK